MMKKLLILTIFACATGHLYSIQFECTWQHAEGPWWPLLHKTVVANNAEEAITLCQQTVLPSDNQLKALSLDQIKALWLQANTKNWTAESAEHGKAPKTTDATEWHCTVEESDAAPLKILATTEQEAHAKCTLMNARHPNKKIVVKKLNK